jgi:hypothetical protein
MLYYFLYIQLKLKSLTPWEKRRACTYFGTEEVILQE